MHFFLLSLSQLECMLEMQKMCKGNYWSILILQMGLFPGNGDLFLVNSDGKLLKQDKKCGVVNF